MTLEERIRELEDRVARLERITAPMLPLGPQEQGPDWEQVTRIADSLRERLERARRK